MGNSVQLQNPLMGDRLAAVAGGVGVTLFGVSLADLGQLATIFAGLMGGFASLMAGLYYVYKIRKGK